jgi:LPXTG-site transpeptidase (sortase) family protein
MSTGEARHGGATLLCAVALLVLALSLIGKHDTSSESGPASGPAAAAGSGASSRPSADTESDRLSGRPEGRHLPRSRPLRLMIPKIAVDAPFTDLAVGRDGQLEAPPANDVNLVGWHAKGASPGETGTSIIAGHVDTATAPAVFAGLGRLKKGDTFQVVRTDRTRASFMVDSVETFDKDRFPDKRVYGDTDRALVRLITCAGDYDRRAGDYTENLVVFAHLV